MKHVTHKAPGFLAARLSLYLAGAASAAFGVAGWWKPEPDVASIVLIAFTALSALVVPLNIEIVGRNRWSFFLLAPAIVFGAIGSYSFHHSVETMIEAPREAEHHEVHVAPLAAALTDARDATKAAQAAVTAHVAPVIPETMGPKNIAARLALWEAAHKPLTEALATAQAVEAKAEADLKAAPVYVPMIPNLIVWAVAVSIDICLAFGLAGIAMVRASMQKQIDTAKAKAERAEARRKEKAAEARRLARQAAAKKAAKEAKKAPKQPAYTGPKLVAAND